MRLDRRVDSSTRIKTNDMEEPYTLHATASRLIHLLSIQGAVPHMWWQVAYAAQAPVLDVNI
jgi:hypothetical protein